MAGVFTVKRILEMDEKFAEINVRLKEHDNKLDDHDEKLYDVKILRRDYRDIAKDVKAIKESFIKWSAEINIKIAMQSPDNKRWSKVVDYIVMAFIMAAFAFIIRTTT